MLPSEFSNNNLTFLYNSQLENYKEHNKMMMKYSHFLLHQDACTPSGKLCFLKVVISKKIQKISGYRLT